MPKDEELKPDEFVCRCCWKKIRSSVKYEIYGHLFFNEETSWQKSKTKFTICFECFNSMLAFVDDKATEIVERISNEEPISSPEDQASLHRFKAYVQNRYNALENLLNALNRKLGLKGRIRENKVEEESKETQEPIESVQEEEGGTKEKA